jgi:hypothetical protein
MQDQRTWCLKRNELKPLSHTEAQCQQAQNVKLALRKYSKGQAMCLYIQCNGIQVECISQVIVSNLPRPSMLQQCAVNYM